MPLAIINRKEVHDLLDYFWNNRKTKLSFTQVKQTSYYNNCKSLFADSFAKLFDEAVKNIMFDIREFDSHQFEIFNGKIGYKD